MVDQKLTVQRPYGASRNTALQGDDRQALHQARHQLPHQLHAFQVESLDIIIGVVILLVATGG